LTGLTRKQKEPTKYLPRLYCHKRLKKNCHLKLRKNDLETLLKIYLKNKKKKQSKN
jgi:hypothetical protein